MIYMVIQHPSDRVLSHSLISDNNMFKMAKEKSCNRNLFDQSVVLVNTHIKKKMAYTHRKPKVKKIAVEASTSTQTSEVPVSVRHRCSARRRIAPVEFWNGEAVKYDDDGTLMGIENIGAGPSSTELSITNKDKAKRTSTTTKKIKTLQLPEIKSPIITKPDRKRKRSSSSRGSNSRKRQCMTSDAAILFLDESLEDSSDYSWEMFCNEHEKSTKNVKVVQLPEMNTPINNQPDRKRKRSIKSIGSNSSKKQDQTNDSVNLCIDDSSDNSLENLCIENKTYTKKDKPLKLPGMSTAKSTLSDRNHKGSNSSSGNKSSKVQCLTNESVYLRLDDSSDDSSEKLCLEYNKSSINLSDSTVY